MINRKVVIRRLPEGQLAADDFELVEEPLSGPAEGEVLLETLAVTIAAGARAGLQGSASYAGAPQTGIVMNAHAVLRVVQSNNAEWQPGDLAVAPSGWQSHVCVAPEQLQRVDKTAADPTQYLSLLGTNGLTAYFGLLEIGEPKAGETVLVSAAAGSVGHLVGQIAKIQGAHVVGVCGDDAKGARLVNELGFDAVVNYKDGNFRTALKEATPDGVDVYFDNTGGPILGSALFRMNVNGRIVCCGVVSQYDTNTPEPGPKGVPGLLVNKRIKMQGFLVFDFADQYSLARQNLQQWQASGQLQSWHDEFDGLESAPRAFVDLLAGGNIGTRIIRVAS